MSFTSHSISSRIACEGLSQLITSVNVHWEIRGNKSHHHTEKKDPNYIQDKYSGISPCQQCLSHSWAIYSSHLPLCWWHILQQHSTSPYYNTHRTNIDLPLPPSTSTEGHHQPAYQAEAAWNQLAAYIRKIKNKCTCTCFLPWSSPAADKYFLSHSYRYVIFR